MVHSSVLVEAAALLLSARMALRVSEATAGQAAHHQSVGRLSPTAAVAAARSCLEPSVLVVLVVAQVAQVPLRLDKRLARQIGVAAAVARPSMVKAARLAAPVSSFSVIRPERSMRPAARSQHPARTQFIRLHLREHLPLR